MNPTAMETKSFLDSDNGRIVLSHLRAVATTVLVTRRLVRLVPNLRFRHLQNASYKNDLKVLVRDHNREKLSQLRGIHGVAEHLQTDLHTGIGGSSVTTERAELISKHLEEELTGRRHVFGTNAYCTRQSTIRSILQIIKKNFRDKIQNVYIICGIVLFALGIVKPELDCSIGIALLIFSILNAAIGVGIDYCVLKRLDKLALQCEEHMQAHVIRCGRRWLVPQQELVVGDLVELRCGDQIPADGLLVENHSLQIIEATNQHEGTACLASTFLTSGSRVQHGFGFMLVTAVGKDTQWSKPSLKESNTSHKNTRTNILRRPEIWNGRLEKLKLSIALLYLLVLLPFYLSGHFRTNPSGYFRKGETRAIVVIFNIVNEFYKGFSVIVAVVLDSLFRAISMALLYFIPRMAANGALIQKLETCEIKLGLITTICTGKAGLLTLDKTEVKRSWIAGALHDEACHHKELVQPWNAIPEDIRALLFEGLALNTTGNLYKNADLRDLEVISCGSRTEKALLRWGHQNGLDFDTIRQKCTVLKVESFDPERKRSGVSLRRESDGRCIVHWKGAADTILSSCSRWICVVAESGEVATMSLSEPDRSDIEETITNMGINGLSCVAFAYCEVGLVATAGAQAAAATMPLQEVDLTLLAVLGMKEPCRPEAMKDVKKARNAGLRVITVTGDSLAAARAIAKECGIIEENDDESTDQVVDGPTFREWIPTEKEERLRRLAVLSRAFLSDKLLLVESLRGCDRKEVVAVTGHKHTDALALQRADVGFSLGSGVQVAKESSDIILLDDSFTSILKCIEWGRCICCNFQHFLHFQVTIRIATALVPSMTGMQFQWIDLMTTLATIALIMQPPLLGLMWQPPIPHNEPLFTYPMWRNVALQAIYQVILFGKMINFRNEDLNSTIIFNSFIFCQVINLVNARQTEIFQGLRRLSHMNILQGLGKRKVLQGVLRWSKTNIVQKNHLLLAILVIIAIVQVVLVQFAGSVLSTKPLNWTHWLFCVGLASGGWVIAVLGECLPIPDTHL